MTLAYSGTSRRARSCAIFPGLRAEAGVAAPRRQRPGVATTRPPGPPDHFLVDIARHPSLAR